MDLKELALAKTNEWSFFTIYLPAKNELEELKKKMEKFRKVLKSDEQNKDELEYFDENVKIILNLRGLPKAIPLHSSVT